MAYDCYAKASGKGTSSKGRRLVCYKCGVEGHKAEDCRAKGAAKGTKRKW